MWTRRWATHRPPGDGDGTRLVRNLGTPIKLSRAGRHAARTPRFGQDSDEVLASHGFSEDEIAALREQGIVMDTRRK